MVLLFRFNNLGSIGPIALANNTNNVPINGRVFPLDEGFTPNQVADNELWTVWV